MNGSVLVTGASSGIGREIAIALANEGWHVLLNGRDKNGLRETQDRCANVSKWRDEGPSFYCAGDIRFREVRERLVAYCDLYQVRTIFLCAAKFLNCPEGDVRGITDENELSEILDTSLSNIKLIWMLQRGMEERHGTIVHLNSVAGRNIAVGESIYAASKHAMSGFIKSYRFEARKKGIRVMDVFLGGTKTPMTFGRPEYDKLIDPREAAQTIVNAAMLWPPSM